MGISIKREDKERLAREVAARRGEGLTEAIHHALSEEMRRLEHTQSTPRAIDEDLATLFARLDVGGPGNGRSLSEIETEIYGEFGEPI